jgi:hypothetical protein
MPPAPTSFPAGCASRLNPVPLKIAKDSSARNSVKGSSVTDLYPEIDLHEHGMLEVGGGDLIYWESCGNPRGRPLSCMEAQVRMSLALAKNLCEEGHIGLLTPLSTRPKTSVAAAATTNEVSDAPSQEEAVGKPSHSPNKLVIPPAHHETVPGLIQL